MRAALLVALVLLSCYIDALLPNVVDASNEVEHLRRLIASQRSGHDSRAGWSSDALHPVYVGPQEGMMEADRIESLPGQPKGIGFVQYSGYVTVDPSAGRALFYYFVESPQNSSSKPLVLWLNGGPGCSSLGAGAMTELGPFRPNSDGTTLQSNDYAWNNAANIIFLESPAGVGFSYSNTTSDYDSSGDKRTAIDAYTFLVNWLERFPQYKTRDFFITGESYAGHYIPELASTIIKNNKITSHIVINLKGIAMGNAYVDGDTNTKATYDYFWTHALISEQAYKAIQSSCGFSGSSKSYSGDCNEAMATADAEIGNIDQYNVYSPLCHEPSKSMDQTVPSKGVDPCVDYYVASYLNLPEVQKALHANVTGLSFPWSVCSDVINWNDAPATLLPTIKDLIASGIRVWMYSGDQDSVVSVTSTRDSIDMLGVSVKISWRPWYSNDEVGGYVVGYEGLTFATIRGAGHMVPGDQAERALTFISSFLKGVLPPSA